MSALFEARGLAKRFGDAVVLEDITLAFEAGRLSGIMGPNGADKTTCFNCLTGRYKPDRGEVWFAGENITGLAPRDIARRGIARSFQIMNLFDEYSALENVLVALPGVREREFDLLGDLARQSALVDEAGTMVGILEGIDVFAWDKPKYVARVYRTERLDHPGGRLVSGDARNKLVGGRLRVLPQPVNPEYGEYILSPRMVRARMLGSGWS